MKTIFWNVDTQEDFMLKDGSLYIKDAETILPNLNILTQYARDKNIKVVNTADWHVMKSKEISENPDFETTFPPHCLVGTTGAHFVDETNPARQPKEEKYYIIDHLEDREIDEDLFNICRNIVIYKDAFDVFQGNKLTEKIISLLGKSLFVVYGVATNVCVDFAVMGLLKRGGLILVVKDAIKELPGSNLDEIFKKWEDNNVSLMMTDELIKQG